MPLITVNLLGMTIGGGSAAVGLIKLGHTYFFTNKSTKDDWLGLLLIVMGLLISSATAIKVITDIKL